MNNYEKIKEEKENNQAGVYAGLEFRNGFPREATEEGPASEKEEIFARANGRRAFVKVKGMVKIGYGINGKIFAQGKIYDAEKGHFFHPLPEKSNE